MWRIRRITGSSSQTAALALLSIKTSCVLRDAQVGVRRMGGLPASCTKNLRREVLQQRWLDTPESSNETINPTARRREREPVGRVDVGWLVGRARFDPGGMQALGQGSPSAASSDRTAHPVPSKSASCPVSLQLLHVATPPPTSPEFLLSALRYTSPALTGRSVSSVWPGIMLRLSALRA